MDDSKEFQHMLERAIWAHPIDFKDFDESKNVQDQLQAMMLPTPADHEDFDTKIDHAFWLAQDFAKGIQERKWSQQTMEQLWLGYVMRERYQKVWNDEDWVAA